METKAVFNLNIPLDIKESIYKWFWKHIYNIDPDLKADIQSFAMLNVCLDRYSQKYNNMFSPLQYLDVILYDMCIEANHHSDNDITYMIAYYIYEDDDEVHITLTNDIPPENKYSTIRKKWTRMSSEERNAFAYKLLD